ncbi:MAG: hypothetical protein IKX86_05535 [Clostridia bacterium]|nr:hypothetical protein [Clostridia bacterium]
MKENAAGRAPARSFTVSRAFGDGMIVQRNNPIRIWGWAPESEEGRTVSAELGGLTGSAAVTGGRWEITLEGTLPECTEGKTLRVFGGGAEKSFSGVLVGDVYWVIGQSNVAYSVSEAKTVTPESDPARSVPIDDALLIRLNRSCFYEDLEGIPQRGTDEVCEDVVQRRGWEKPSEGGMRFSALGYFTAYLLYEKLGRRVPVGMIQFDGNGLPLHCFLPNEVRNALGVSTLTDGLWRAEAMNCTESSFMYNDYIYSFRRMPISGIIWYQGESDCQDVNGNNVKYTERFAAMIKYFRDAHDLPEHDYPVYYVEFPPIYTPFYFDRVRQTMGGIPSAVPNSHVCVTSDLWKDREFPNNLHPYNKYAISERMASIIAANAYGMGRPDCAEGPSAVSCSFSDDGREAVIAFRNVGGGLMAEGGELRGIGVITEPGGGYSDAEAEITAPDEVTVRSEKPILAVGYNNRIDASFPEDMTLCSGTGMPCAAFRFER